MRFYHTYTYLAEGLAEVCQHCEGGAVERAGGAVGARGAAAGGLKYRRGFRKKV
jgi:hypothetical protein